MNPNNEASRIEGQLQTQWRLATNRDLDEGQKIDAMLDLGASYLEADGAWIVEIDQFNNAHIHHQSERHPSITDEIKLDWIRTLSNRIDDNPNAPWITGSMTLAADQPTILYIAAPLWLATKRFGFLCFTNYDNIERDYSPQACDYVDLLAAGFSQILLQIHQQLALQDLALTDVLTGLPNRRAAEMRLNEEIARAEREHSILTVSICDLDRFKLINDHYGHKTGDIVLKRAAHTLQQQMRDGDWIARWGGEEFLIYLHHADSDQAYQAIDRLRLIYQQTPFVANSGTLELTLSVGMASVQADKIDLTRLLADADSALYEAKNAGRNRVVLNRSGQRATLWHAGEIQDALKNNHLIPAYQPIVDLRTGKVVAEEALARLINKQGHPTPAAEFIEAAEGLQLIHLVDETITRQTMAHCVNSQNSKDNPDLAHFVNLSPQFLSRPEMVSGLLDSVKQHCVLCDTPINGVKPLVFEITERQFINDFELLTRQIQPLLDMGFRLALDDFGSGYSSFLYLAKLPISFLKIEGWMVTNMHGNAKIIDIIQAIIDISHKQNIITIAENIEDAETAELLAKMGVNWGQGYYFGRPECNL
ncbi:putative bifunctional diguanylate cyclase/phosphodiesterase [Sulfuriferula thiophila]|uniref:putative bifunctional diguanylate cyclase/phosphodiesterase n=1 Tax=Sulfuriferula thiophila TaxID=1781211 RepID=UPI000F60FA8A|nr:bifunctional diguanylate cyclase/phosphodiesterase [Sulfuriferula thiophila]